MQLLDRQEEVHEQLEDAIFVAAWRKLVAHCPWATAFQDVPFVRTWWRIYQDVYAPLLLIQKDEHQAVTGLIALARHRRDESVNMTINLFKQIAHDTRRLGDDLETLVLVRKGDTVLDLALQRLGCQLHQ